MAVTFSVLIIRQNTKNKRIEDSGHWFITITICNKQQGLFVQCKGLKVVSHFSSHSFSAVLYFLTQEI